MFTGIIETLGTIKKVVKALEGASKAHAGQAKMLRKVLASPIPKTKKK